MFNSAALYGPELSRARTRKVYTELMDEEVKFMTCECAEVDPSVNSNEVMARKAYPGSGLRRHVFTSRLISTLLSFAASLSFSAKLSFPNLIPVLISPSKSTSLLTNSQAEV